MWFIVHNSINRLAFAVLSPLNAEDDLAVAIIPSRNPKLCGKDSDSLRRDPKHVARVSHCQDKRFYITREDLVSRVPMHARLTFVSSPQA